MKSGYSRYQNLNTRPNRSNISETQKCLNESLKHLFYAAFVLLILALIMGVAGEM